MSGEIHFKRTTVGEEILGIRLDNNLSDFFNKSFQCLGMQSKWECEEWVPFVLIGDDITLDSGSEGKFYLEKLVCCIDIYQIRRLFVAQ